MEGGLALVYARCFGAGGLGGSCYYVEGVCLALAEAGYYGAGGLGGSCFYVQGGLFSNGGVGVFWRWQIMWHLVSRKALATGGLVAAVF